MHEDIPIHLRDLPICQRHGRIVVAIVRIDESIFLCERIEVPPHLPVRILELCPKVAVV